MSKGFTVSDAFSCSKSGFFSIVSGLIICISDFYWATSGFSVTGVLKSLFDSGVMAFSFSFFDFYFCNYLAALSYSLVLYF